MTKTPEQRHDSWSIDDNDDVCVIWQNLRSGEENCYAVTLDDRALSWESKSGSGTGQLRGTVAESFLDPE